MTIVSSSVRRGLVATLLTATVTAAGFLGATSTAAAAPSTTDLSCKGQGVDSSAKIRYGTEKFIKAPISKIWRLQTDIARWPSWQAPVTTAKRLDHGPLRAGSAFVWTTPAPPTPTTPATVLTITSTVQQARHNTCLRWTGPAIGTGLKIDKGTHVWNFVPVRGGTLVRTEETWNGAQVEADTALSTTMLGMGLEAWLNDLKAAAEHLSCG
ncbi:SRPBCC family protein [Kribbella sp. NPDC056861]|uniref:SRPBCC family protein n=1 Tax=Kribbella sp. NPDC056861 TaxID=3154857 RepID=UPI003447B77E